MRIACLIFRDDLTTGKYVHCAGTAEQQRNSAAASRRHAQCPHVASVPVPSHRDDLWLASRSRSSCASATFVEEPVPGPWKDREGRLPRELRFEMIALEHHIEHRSEIELVFSDAVAGCEVRTRAVLRPCGRHPGAGRVRLPRRWDRITVPLNCHAASQPPQTAPRIAKNACGARQARFLVPYAGSDRHACGAQLNIITV